MINTGNMEKRKIRINKLPNNPSFEYGGQTAGYALDLNSKSNFKDGFFGSVSQTLKSVDPDSANIEAEGGETVLGDFSKDGIPEHFKIQGKKHSQGGVPLSVPVGSFIFSDSKKMEIGGPVLEMFGKNGDSKKKYTPATLAKQYDINKYKAIVDSKTADPISKKTASMMMENNLKKLGQIALLQEAKKGYPTGTPAVSEFWAGGKVKAASGLNYLYPWQGATLDEVTSTAQRGNNTIPLPDLNPPQTMSYIPMPHSGFSMPGSPVNRQVNRAQTNDGTPYGWTRPDTLNAINSLYDYATMPVVTPYEPAIPMPERPRTTYADPTRELAQNSEMANQAMNANMLLAGTGSRFRNSAVQGQAAANASNILGRYNNTNVELANRTSAINADITNQYNQAQANRERTLYDKNAVLQQNLYNSRKQGRADILRSFISGDAHAAQLYNENIMSPHYYIDPRTGKREFRPGQDALSVMNSSQGSGFSEGEYLKYYNEIKNTTGDATLARTMADRKFKIGKVSYDPQGGTRASGQSYLPQFGPYSQVPGMYPFTDDNE